MKRLVKGLGTAAALFFIFDFFKHMANELEYYHRNWVRLRGYYDILLKWMQDKNSDIKLENFFASRGIKSIAIYGMGEIGVLLYEELKNSSIEIKYCLDESTNKQIDGVRIINMNNMSSEETVDAIIVTPVHQFQEIADKIIKYHKNIISLRDIIFQ